MLLCNGHALPLSSDFNFIMMHCEIFLRPQASSPHPPLLPPPPKLLAVSPGRTVVSPGQEFSPFVYRCVPWTLCGNFAEFSRFVCCQSCSLAAKILHYAVGGEEGECVRPGVWGYGEATGGDGGGRRRSGAGILS